MISPLVQNKGILLCSLLLGVLIIFGIIFLTFFSKPAETLGSLLTNPDQTTHIVTLTKDGWVPEEIVIRKGEKVVFNNTENTPYWPASSLHPNHGIYPEFDPKERIMPPENWEFVFDKAGTWKYHDHINEHKTGIIVVIDPDVEESSSKRNLTSCAPLTGYEKQQCWDAELSKVLEEEGLAAAFEFFVELYRTEPDVPKACHEWGHSLGEASYKVYKETGELMLEPEASYCGYGYFHSFIAELVKDTGEFEKVLDFCDQVVKELEDELSGVAGNCVHGVGHGTTAWLLENPDNWGNFQKTADEGTAICERIYSSHGDLENCYDGVYNELHLDLFNDLYGLSFSEFMAKDDPFWICHEQKEAHKRACYFEFVGIFWKIFEMDFHKAIQYVVNNIHGLEERGPEVVEKIAGDWIQFDIVNDSFERNIEGCRSIPTFLMDACIKGIMNGFVQHGDPTNMHGKGIAFCNADYLSEEERGLCFDHLLGALRY